MLRGSNRPDQVWPEWSGPLPSSRASRAAGTVSTATRVSGFCDPAASSAGRSRPVRRRRPIAGKAAAPVLSTAPAPVRTAQPKTPRCQTLISHGKVIRNLTAEQPRPRRGRKGRRRGDGGPGAALLEQADVTTQQGSLDVGFTAGNAERGPLLRAEAAPPQAGTSTTWSPSTKPWSPGPVADNFTGRPWPSAIGITRAAGR